MTKIFKYWTSKKTQTVILLGAVMAVLIGSVFAIIRSSEKSSSFWNIVNAQSQEAGVTVTEVGSESAVLGINTEEIVVNYDLHKQGMVSDTAKIDQAFEYLAYLQRLEEEKARLAEEARIKAEQERLAAEAAARAQAQALYPSSNFTGNAADLIRAKFGANADKALAIANCESGLNPNAIGDKSLMYLQSGTYYGASYGLFQIRYLPGRPSPDWLIIPENNIQKAYEMSGGGVNWSAWSCAKKLGIY